MDRKALYLMGGFLLCVVGCFTCVAHVMKTAPAAIVTTAPPASPGPAGPPESEEARQARLKATRGDVLAAAKNDIDRKNYQQAYNELNALDIQGIANDPEYRRLFSRAKSGLARAKASAERQEHQAGIGARKAYAQTLREHFLDKGLDIKVHASGAAADRLTMTFVLFNDVWVHNFLKGDLLREIWSQGFRTVYMEDGFNYAERITPPA
jgi:hypothetical protein